MAACSTRVPPFSDPVPAVFHRAFRSKALVAKALRLVVPAAFRGPFRSWGGVFRVPFPKGVEGGTRFSVIEVM